MNSPFDLAQAAPREPRVLVGRFLQQAVAILRWMELHDLVRRGNTLFSYSCIFATHVDILDLEHHGLIEGGPHYRITRAGWKLLAP